MLIMRTEALKELLETQQGLSRTQGERVTELEKTAKSVLNNFLELKEENGELRAQLDEFLDSWTPQEPKTGQATWYGDFFDGKPTRYCADIYDVNGFTAASNTLPPCVFAKITNLENGREIVVWINDTGGFTHSIDLSQAAFESLGDIDQGVISVSIECCMQKQASALP